MYTLTTQGKQKLWKEIIGKLGWWIDRQPKAKSHLKGRGGVLHATLRRDHLAFPGDLLGTLRSTPSSHHMHYPLRNTNSIATLRTEQEVRLK